MRLSFIYHIISATIGLIGTIYFLYNVMFNKLEPYRLNSLIFLLASTLALQAILNFAEEYVYDFYPLLGKTEIGQKPVSRRNIFDSLINN